MSSSNSGEFLLLAHWLWYTSHCPVAWSRMEQVRCIHCVDTVPQRCGCDVCVDRLKVDGNLSLGVTNANHLPKHSQPPVWPWASLTTTTVGSKSVCATVGQQAALIPHYMGSTCRVIWTAYKNMSHEGQSFRSSNCNFKYANLLF